jgi:lysophospholipase L1-like esterase
MKILCIGDSLALPGHLNKYEDIWFYKLKNEFHKLDFLTFFKRQLTTDVLVTMGGGIDGIDNMPKGADCLEFFMPQVVILQLGIVDCAPRLLNDNERKIIRKLPSGIAGAYIKMVKKLRKRNPYKTMVNRKSFTQNLENFLERCKKAETKVIVTSISIPDSNMVAKNPMILQNVKEYNDIYLQLEKKYEFVEVTNPLQAIDYKYTIYEDGYHPNALGHQIIYKEIVEKINGFS